MVDADRVLLNHALLVKRLDLLLFESFVVVFVKLSHADLQRHLLVLEVVHQVSDEWPHFFLLMEHGHHKIDELVRVLRHRFRILIHD